MLPIRESQCQSLQRPTLEYLRTAPSRRRTRIVDGSNRDVSNMMSKRLGASGLLYILTRVEHQYAMLESDPTNQVGDSPERNFRSGTSLKLGAVIELGSMSSNQYQDSR